jgi:CMP-2-keto-3-deoxyoctulosonic acid synthetase
MKNTEVVQNDWKAIADLLKRIKQYMSEHPDAIILVESHKRRTPQDDDALKSVKFVHKTAGMKLKFSKTPIRMERDGHRQRSS